MSGEGCAPRRGKLRDRRPQCHFVCRIFLARLGATRGGSPGIFGYTGGHAVSGGPAAVSRSCIATKGSSDCGDSSAHGSPATGTRLGTVTMVSASGSIASSSSQFNGVDTCAPGRARTDQAPKIVLCGAFWL